MIGVWNWSWMTRKARLINLKASSSWTKILPVEPSPSNVWLYRVKLKIGGTEALRYCECRMSSSKKKSRRDPVYDLFKQDNDDVARVFCSQQGCNTKLLVSFRWFLVTTRERNLIINVFCSQMKADTLKKHLSRHHREVYDTLTAAKSQKPSTAADKFLVTKKSSKVLNLCALCKSNALCRWR